MRHIACGTSYLVTSTHEAAHKRTAAPREPATHPNLRQLSHAVASTACSPLCSQTICVKRSARNGLLVTTTGPSGAFVNDYLPPSSVGGASDALAHDHVRPLPSKLEMAHEHVVLIDTPAVVCRGGPQSEMKQTSTPGR